MNKALNEDDILSEGFVYNSGGRETGGNFLTGDGGLSLPTAALMALGGDARITVDEASGLNSYGCAPKPIPAISYASSTASTVSSSAYAQARACHFRLQDQARHAPIGTIYAGEMNAARARLRRLYGLDQDIDIAFAPSGTDLEYLVLAIALRGKRPVRNFVVEVDEVGSGCLNAQQGRWFAPRTALGHAVETGQPVPGFPPERITIETLAVRESGGPPRHPDERLEEIERRIATAIATGERPLLHAVHRSKTGLIAPSLEDARSLAQRFGDDLDIVVDACQGRISPGLIRGWLDCGAAVLVTGSKFLGGPPFSAFAFIPPRMARRMREELPAPEGLRAIFTRGDMPESWDAVNSVLSDTANFGLLLRLECGLYELGRLLAFPEATIENAIAAFHRMLRELPSDMPFALIEEGVSGSQPPHPLDHAMLHTLRLTALRPDTGDPLDFEDARAIYALLYSDVSLHFDNPRDRMIAAETVHVGQPVRCLRLADGRWAGTLRLSLSAPHISQIAGLDLEELIVRFRADIAWIGDKVRLALAMLPPRQG